jgi:hypothetical protein
MMVKVPPHDDPVDKWFPWSCPECNELWWFDPSQKLKALPCCIATMDLTPLELLQKVRDSPVDQWRRVFMQIGVRTGKRAALEAVKRCSVEEKESPTYAAVFGHVNETLPVDFHVPIDIDPAFGAFPPLPQWSIEPCTITDEASGLKLSFQVKPEAGAKALIITSEEEPDHSKTACFTSDGRHDGWL